MYENQVPEFASLLGNNLRKYKAMLCALKLNEISLKPNIYLVKSLLSTFEIINK